MHYYVDMHGCRYHIDGMTKRTRTELKHKAQDELLSALQVAFYRQFDGVAGDCDDELVDEMSRQIERIDKLFGSEPRSCARS